MRMWLLLRRRRGRALLAIALLMVSMLIRSHFIPVPLDPNYHPSFDGKRVLDDCQNYDGILLIQHTDMWSGFGTVFFQLIIAQLLYADRYNLLPIIHLGNSSLTVYDPQFHKDNEDIAPRQVNGLMGYSIPIVQIPKIVPDAWYPGPPRRDATSPGREKTTIPLSGTGVWNHYFYNLPICDTTSQKHHPFYSMTADQVSPGLFFHAPWSPKAWRYDRIPIVVAKPYMTLEEWLRPQRQLAATMVQKYYRIQPSILATVQASLPLGNGCLGLHIRWSDKRIARRILSLDEFLPYVQAYLQTHAAATTTSNSKPCIYLATDSWLVWQDIQTRWPPSILSHIYQQQTNQSNHMIRSNDTRHVADLGSHHWVNTQTLVDIVALSNSSFLIHGHSAVSEAAIYLNPELIDRSINLEDPDRYMANESVFAQQLLVHLGRHQDPVSNLPVLPSTRPMAWWWNEGPKEHYHHCSTDPSFSSITLPLAQRDSDGYWLSASQFTVQVFVALVHQLVFMVPSTTVIVDPILFYWFEPGYNNSQESHNCHLVWKSSHNPQEELWNDTTKQLLASVRTRQTYGTTSTTTKAMEDFDLIRKLMHSVLFSTLRPRSFLMDRIPSPNESPCLGIWIADPGHALSSKSTTTKSMVPRDWARAEFYHYIEKFLHTGGTCLYVATESQAIWEQLVQEWKTRIHIYTQARAVRNYGSTKAHWMVDHIERLGSETLVDIFSLATVSKVLVHSPHVIAEAALYWNPNLISIPIAGSETSNHFSSKFDDWLAHTTFSGD